MTVKFEARDMRPEDAREIMKSMWQPGAAELDRIGLEVTDINVVAAKFINMADYGFTFLANGEMVAICGAQRGDDTHYTWFMATPELANIGREFTVWLRKFCKDIVERDGLKLEMFSASQHPNSERWFFALGFERGNMDTGIFRHYRYVRKNKLTVTA